MTGITTIRPIREWEYLRIGEDGVTDGIARRLLVLADAATRRLRVPQPVLTRTRTREGQPSLRAGQVVGVLRVPGASVEILPKIDGKGVETVRRALTRMLAVAWGLPVADTEPALLATQREDLLEVVIRLFADRLLEAARRGLPHRYRLIEDDLPLLRGKLMIRRQLIHHAVRPDRLACQFDELSVDTPLNRVLKAAVSRLAFATRSAANARRLSELAARFEFVGSSSDPRQEQVSLDRTNTAFHRLHRLAHQLLGGDWQTTTTGGHDGFALLFPMNDLFEEFIGRNTRVALAPRPVRLQHTDRHALQGNLFALRPDIVVDNEIVIDTKWKALASNGQTCGVDQSDVYQMLAYARAYNARRLVLLYPWQEGLPVTPIYKRWRVAGTSTPFDIATIDVGRPNSVRTALRKIVDGSAPARPVS